MRCAIAGGAIAAVEPSEGGGPWSGCFVLPGLVDLHQHLPAQNALRMSGLFALAHLAHGVTTVRDAGDVDGTAVPALRRLLTDGALPGRRHAR